MKRAAWALAVFVLLVATAGASLQVAGNEELRASDEAARHGDAAGAIAHAKLAAESRVPFGHASEGGFARLESIAGDAENTGDLTTAKAAWLALRDAADATGDVTREAGAAEALVRIAGKAESTPSGRALEGCTSEGEASCVDSMKASLAAETHPGWRVRALLALVLAAALGAAIFATRPRTKAA